MEGLSVMESGREKLIDSLQRYVKSSKGLVDSPEGMVDITRVVNFMKGEWLIPRRESSISQSKWEYKK